MIRFDFINKRLGRYKQKTWTKLIISFVFFCIYSLKVIKFCMNTLFLFFFYAKRSTEALCLRKGWLANCLKGEYNDSIL